MNEDALDLAYNLAIEEGYRKSKSDFINLLATDLDALKISYEIAKEEGYTDSLEEFSVLIGNKALPEKKNLDLTITESPTEDGSSDSSEDKKPLPDYSQYLKNLDLTEYEKEQIDMSPEPARSDQISAQIPELPKDELVEEEDGSVVTRQQFQEKLDKQAEEDRLRYEKERQIELEIEREKKKSAKNNLLFENIPFQKDIVTIDDSLTEQKEGEVVDYLTTKFSKYGFVFEPTGLGNKVLVRTLDGLNSIEVSVNTNDPESSKSLKEFIVKYSTSPEEREVQVDDFITKAVKAQRSRKVGRQNRDGSVSTHLMSYAEEDGRFVAFPMLFPANPEIQSSFPDRWEEFEGNDWENALAFAKTRDEAYYFDTEEEAKKFAEGAWKHVDAPEILAQEIYAENGLDYFAEQEMFQNYEKARNDVSFLKSLDEGTKLSDLTPEEQKLYGEYFFEGNLDPDIENQIKSLEAQRDDLRDVVMSSEREDLRDKLDLQLQNAFEVKAKNAAKINQEALDYKDQLEVLSLQTFGVPIEQLDSIVPENEQQVNQILALQNQNELVKKTREFSAYKYELAKTFYSRKNDENLMREYVTGMKAFKISLGNALKRGKVGNLLLKMKLGLIDGTDEEVQERLAELMASRDPRQSKLLYRFDRAKDGEAKQYVLGESGLNAPMAVANGVALMAESLTQLLPYGSWIVPLTTVGGALGGAGIGAATTGGAGAIPGGLIGAKKGFNTGMSLSSFILEYTNSLIEGFEKQGYDLTNPEEVKKAMSDKEAWKEGGELGVKRGIPILLVDLISKRLAGRVFSSLSGPFVSTGRKVAGQVAERAVFDPLAEGFGELLAQVNAGQEIDGKEIFLESWGGLGNNASSAGVNLLVETATRNNTKLANNLIDFDFMANQSVSDAQISNWSTNMRNLNKISAEQDQQIQKNIGFKRTAKEMLGKNASNKTVSRVMELLSAKSDLSRTNNLKQINTNTIADIDAELAQIVNSGNIVKDGINVNALRDVQSQPSRKAVYMIDGKMRTKAQFVRDLDKMTDSQLENAVVSNDNEVKNLLNNKRKKILDDAIQESKTESVDVGEQTTDGATMGTRDTQQETTPESETTQVQEQEVEVETETPAIPTPAKATRTDKNRYANNELENERLDSLLAEIANKNMNNKKLTPFQKQLATENESRLAEIESDMQGVVDLEKSLQEDTQTQANLNNQQLIDEANANLDGQIEDLNNEIASVQQQLKQDLAKKGLTRDDKIELREEAKSEIESYKEDIKEAKRENRKEIARIKRENRGTNVEFKTEGKIDDNAEFVEFKSQQKSNTPKMKRAPVEGGIQNAFNNLVNQLSPERSRGGMMFTTGIFKNNNPSFELDADLVERIKNKETEVKFLVMDGSKMTKEQRDFYQVNPFKTRVFLHADGQLVGRLEMVSGKEGIEMSKENGTVTISEIHPELQGLGLGQQMYESANDYVQETYNQPLKSDKNYTSERAERTWSALEEKGKTTRRKPTMRKSPSMQVLRNKERQVMGETQFSFKDEKMLVDAVNQAYNIYGPLTSSEIMKVISGLVTEGDPVNNNTQLLAFMNKSFPSVNISSTQEAFNNVINRQDVRNYTRDGVTYYGVTVDGDIWINPEVHNSQSELFNTSIHEFGHVWTNYLQTTEKGREIYKKGTELVMQTQLYKKQLRKFNGDVKRAVNETMAILIANKGEDIASASLISKFKNWLQGMWTYIKSQFKMSKDLTVSDIENMTLDTFLGTALADIFSGKEIKLTDKQLIQLKNPDVMFSSTDSIIDIVNKGRQQGISDASIKSVLQSRGFKARDINEALRIQVDENVTLPTEFTNIDGGAIEGFRLFNEIKNKLNKFAYTTSEGKRRARRVRTYADVRAEAQRLLKESELYQKQNKDTQMAMQVALDNSLRITSNPTIQKEISAIKNIIKNKKLAVKDIKSLQNQLRTLIRKVLPKSETYSQTQINSLLKRITDLTPQNYVAKTEEVMKIIDKQKSKIKNQLIEKIKKLVRKKAAAAVTPGGRKVSKGLDAIGRDFFKQVNNILKVALISDSDTRNAEIQKIKNDISPETIFNQLQITESELISKALNNPETLTDREQAMLNKIKAFDTVGDIMSASMEEVQAKLKILEEARAESIGRLQLKRLERATKQERLSEQATKQIEETYPELFTTDKDGNKIPKNQNELNQDRASINQIFKDKKLYKNLKEYLKKLNLKFDSIIGIRDFFKTYLAHLGTLTEILDRSLEGKNFFNNNIYKPLRKMRRNQLLGIEKVNKKFDEIANSIPGITKGYKEIRKKLYIGIIDLNVKGKTLRLSGDELLRIYALSKNDVQRAKLERQGFTPEKIDEIKKILGPQTIEFADKIVEFLSTEYFDSVNKVYKESNDISLDYVENYFPTQTLERKSASEELLIKGNFSNIFTDETHSALKERNNKTGEVKIGVGFLDTLTNHVNSMEHYKAYALGVKDLTAIINTPAVKVLLDASGLGRGIKQAINFAVNPDSISDGQMTFLEKLQTKFTSYALAFRLMQIPKQASSFFNAFEDYKFIRSRTPIEKQSRATKLLDLALTPVELLAFMADMGYIMLTLPKQLQKAYKLSPVFRDRVQKGLEGDLYGLVSGSPVDRSVSQKETRMGDFLRAFKTAMGSPTMLGDVMGIMGYMANYNADIRAGVDPDVAAEIFENYELTQQTRGGTEKIPLQMKTGFANRFFTMFGSTLFLQMNKVYMGMTNIYRAASKGTVDSNAIRALVLNLGVANVLFVAMANIFKYTKGEDEDKEEVLEQMSKAMKGMNLITQIPLIGGTLEFAVDKIDGKNPRQVQEGVNPLNRVMTQTLKFMTNDDLSTLQKGAKTIESLAELAVGFQFDPFFQLSVEGDGVDINFPIRTLIQQGEVSEEAFYDVIGVSPSYRPNASRKKSRSTGGGSRKSTGRRGGVKRK